MSISNFNGEDLSKVVRKNLYLQYLTRYESSAARHRVPMAVAILSVLFQEFPLWLNAGSSTYLPFVFGASLLAACILSVFKFSTWISLLIFFTVAIFAIIPDWTVFANHTYLALWTISIGIFFKNWWEDETYIFYLRATLGVVMLAAFGQKIIAGTYVDGSFLTYISFHSNSATERMFAVLCNPIEGEACLPIRFISIFILLWQLIVGLLLLSGFNSFIFLLIEIGFLLGAGLYADEMNFQVLNIALLCIVFRYGMPAWLLLCCISLLIVDVFSLSKIFDAVL